MRVIHFATTSVMLKAFVLPLARYQREHGWEVELGCSDELPAGYVSAVPDLEAAGFVVRVVSFPYDITPLRDAVGVVRLWRFFVRHKFDVVHTYASKAGILVRTAARLAGVRFVVHTAYDFHFRAFPPGLRRTLFRWPERLVASFTDVLLCAATTIYDTAVQERLVPPDRIRLIGAPLADLERFRVEAPERDALRAELALARDAPVVACVSRLVDYKGIDTLLRAARRVVAARPATRFVVMGGGPLEHQLRRMAVDLGLEAQVRFTGYRGDERDVVRLLALAQVFCLPTRREGFGVAFAEAMAMECPVVGPKIEPVSSVVRDGETGFLVHPEDDAAYADAIIRLLDDADLRERFGRTGRAHIHAQFDPAEMYGAVTGLYPVARGAAA